jgi:hypothetical protein
MNNSRLFRMEWIAPLFIEFDSLRPYNPFI